MACDRDGCSVSWEHLHVTDVLQGAGLVDARWFTEEGRIRGTFVHEAIALGARLNWDTLDPALAPFVEGASAFLRESAGRVVQAETRVEYPSRGYLGRLDAIVETPRGLWLIDWKTGTAPDWVGPQTAAYKAALVAGAVNPQEQVRWLRAKRACVELPGNGRYRVIPLDDRHDDVVFFGALVVTQWKRKHRA